jgi:lambda family phage portal protein
VNLLDRAIEAISPGWAARRERARLLRKRMEEAQAYYDGATRGRRGSSFRDRTAAPDVIARDTLSRLRTRSRDLIRNNAYARRAREAIVSNTIGTGVTPQFTRDGGPAEDLERLKRDCLESTEIDADGRHTYRGLQSLAFNAVVESGEVLIRRRRRRLEDGLHCPVQFQVLEADFLDTSKDGPTETGGKIVQGVEFDAIGRRRAYWLYDEHPGSRRVSLKSRPIPARDIIHVYRQERPGQVRGIPWSAPVLLRLADFDDYEDAQLVRQKIAACFAAFVEEPFDGGFTPPGVEENDAGELIDSLEPGIVERLPPGSNVKFGDPPTVSDYEEYARVSLRAIAAGFGVSYEALTGDLKGVSFSAGRMGHLEFQRNIDRWRRLIAIPTMCDPLMQWFLEAADLVGYDVDDVDVQHVPPRREMIDPTRETTATKEAIRSGQKTLSQVILEQSGRDPREHLRELAQDLELARDLGLELSSDPAADRTGGDGGALSRAEVISLLEEGLDGDPERLEKIVELITGNGKVTDAAEGRLEELVELLGRR